MNRAVDWKEGAPFLFIRRFLMHKHLEIGFGQIRLPLPDGVLLAGYGAVRPLSKVHDPLYVQCVALRHGAEIHALFVYDLLAVDSLIIDQAEKLIRRQHPHAGVLLFSAIHTHSAPAGVLQTDHGLLEAARFFAGKADPSLAGQMAKCALEAFEEALDDCGDFSSWQSYSHTGRFASLRTQEKAEYLSDFYTIEIEKSNARDLIVLMSNHPTVLDASNTEASADLVWGMRSCLQEAGYDQVVVLNGPCGDLSTRYTRKGAQFEEARRIGKIGAFAVLDGLCHRKPLEFDCSAPVVQTEFILKADQPQPVEQIEEQMKDVKHQLNAVAADPMANPLILRAVRNELEACQAALAKSKSLAGVESVTVPSTIWKWSDQVFVTIPGELFSSLIHEDGLENVHFLCYTNGYILYLPDREACQRKIYEAMASPLAPGESERLLSMILSSIESMQSK